MRILSLGTGLIVALLGSMSLAYGQKATEMFIPMGQSPGLSHKYTYMGQIDDVNKQRRTIKAGGQTIKITGKTNIWLDRSKLKQTNLVGRFSDLQQGQKVEIMFADPKRKQVAAWVKVEMTQP